MSNLFSIFRSILKGVDKGTTVSDDATVSSQGTNHSGLDVALRDADGDLWNISLLDYDSAGGTVNLPVVGIALPGSGGPVAGGTATNPIYVIDSGAGQAKNLWEGQLPASKTTLYTTPASTRTIVLNIVLVNTDVVARSVNLYYKKSGSTSRRLIPNDMSLGAKEKYVIEENITMGAGDVIEGDASAATVVDTVISGLEQV